MAVRGDYQPATATRLSGLGRMNVLKLWLERVAPQTLQQPRGDATAPVCRGRNRRPRPALRLGPHCAEALQARAAEW